MSKLGFNIDANREYSNQYQQIQAAKPEMIVLMINPNDPGKVAPFLAQVPYVVVRYKSTYRGEDAMGGSDNFGSDATANAVKARANSAKAISEYSGLFPAFPKGYWAYYRNEISDWSKFASYVDEMIEWLRLLHELGLKGAVGCFSVGTPDYPVWAGSDMARLLAAILQYDALLILHEYGLNGDMQGLVDPVKGYGDWCLRYRKVWAFGKFAVRYPNLKIGIGESGLDRDHNTGTGGSWQQVGMAPEVYASNSQLFWYDKEIMADNGGARPNVVGSAIFLWANANSPFDIAGYVAQTTLTRITTTHGAITPAPQPSPTPTPVPLPVEQDTTIQHTTVIRDSYIRSAPQGAFTSLPNILTTLAQGAKVGIKGPLTNDFYQAFVGETLVGYIHRTNLP